MNTQINQCVDTFVSKNNCRICLKKTDTVYSLFHKHKGIFPFEKLNKIGVNTDVYDIGSPCICSDCLIELDITINFLEKCERSNQILTARLAREIKFPEQKANCKGEESIDHENFGDLGNGDDIGTEISKVYTTDTVTKTCNEIVLSLDEARCDECGSKRRCQHWNPPTTHTCPYCQKVFSRKFNFKLHLARHGGARDWCCRACGARAPSRWLAAAHCAPRARRVCPELGCGKTYTTTTNLNTHLRTHTGERPFECNDCGKKFSSKNTLGDHVRIHTGVLPYICPVCGKRFRTNKLSAHARTHARRPPAPRPARPAAPRAPAPPAHACALCSASYHHRQSLNKHVKKQHAKKSLCAETEPNPDPV